MSVRSVVYASDTAHVGSGRRPTPSSSSTDSSRLRGRVSALVLNTYTRRHTDTLLTTHKRTQHRRRARTFGRAVRGWRAGPIDGASGATRLIAASSTRRLGVGAISLTSTHKTAKHETRRITHARTDTGTGAKRHSDAPSASSGSPPLALRSVAEELSFSAFFFCFSVFFCVDWTTR